MHSKDVKDQVHKFADRVEDGIGSASDTLHDGGEALMAKADAMQDQLRDLGRRLLGNTRELGSRANDQLKLHPVAAFGIAFAAGVLLSRALRR